MSIRSLAFFNRSPLCGDRYLADTVTARRGRAIPRLHDLGFGEHAGRRLAQFVQAIRSGRLEAVEGL
jgi:hypothetical protein